MNGEVTDQVPTNLDLLRIVVQETVQKAISDMPMVGDTTIIVITPETTHSADWMMKAVISETLTHRDFRVITDQIPKNHATIPRFLYLVVDLNVAYPARHRNYLIGATRITRVARARLSFQLIDGKTDKVLWMCEETASRTDSFLKEELLLVQSDLYPFAKAAVQEEDINRVLEPIIVSGVVGGLIYLFFSNR